ncbi:M43 family zinc metalloprotease [Botryobacter ruber]|uniref:M43 family zinc metalloprotease n=1 Tax=Botryobacter ruber TaxID=2171629 RepID=UPI000E0BB533|nr:M43 family zinc metalloprotease [Botryobacter ruber]
MRAIFLTILLWSAALAGYSQQQTASATQPLHGRACGTTDVFPDLQVQYPGFAERRQEIVQAVQEGRQQSQQLKRLQQEQARIVIPVVFHVVYNSEAENISNEQLLSQLNILNADFGKKNADTVNTPDYFKALAADTGIEFCLASLDPEGNPTNGITRTRTSKTTFSSFSNDVMFTGTGGIDAWNSNQYLNIWVCRIGSVVAGEVVGYANPPGSPAAIDGVVLHFNAVGAPPYNNYRWAFNLGRTATHEVGHWLGLRHIWGTSANASCSDSDGIDDTPNQAESTTGCPAGMVVSCGNEPHGNMWQNYMDYTDDACMNLFTHGQAAYMQAVLTTVRASILTSPACTGNLLADFELTNPQDTLIIAGTTVTFTDKTTGTRPTSWRWQFEGGTPATSTEQHPTVTYTTPGRFSVRLTASNGVLTDTQTKEQFIQVTVSAVTVYPNPAREVLVIEQQAREEVQQVELVNRMGQTVLSQEVNGRVARLQVSHLAAGMYFLRVHSTDGVEIKKIVLVR